MRAQFRLYATIDRNQVENAILKSVQGAEYNLLLTLRNPDLTPINPESVLTPTDHGRVYYLKGNAEKLRWLYEGGCHKGYIEDGVGASNINRLYEHLSLVTVDLSDPKTDLKVARVFSKWLVPINFGFNSAHYLHPILQHSVGINPESLKMPHYFA